MDTKTSNILLSGVGGQGILLAGQILAETALASGYDVKKAEVHGMAQRGGSVVSHVRFGNEVFSPLISEGEADFLIAFEALEALRYLGYLRADATIILNEQKILPQPVRIGDATYPGNILEICQRAAGLVLAVNADEAAETLGDRRVANILLLGMLSIFLPFPMANWLDSIRERVPVKTFSTNQKAFENGRLLAEQQTHQ
ncbi:MAG: indolepyruvate oxidoreductase subunit beta [candidate division KSB1 bacterium]|nr:indolepyruvate oxidoreductase subunit beta [candidate division KSB1 bacterium]MDZ7303528.1 indolepyruvate oxidoreductase subunit beta [candidate division KSB1 bacterium]MDZ7312670.1 indolepyruvate oxidoreductase subunit beta [candidate division KSB1 bacterium]